MPLVSVQCPNCGAPVDAPRVGSTVVCGSCGSTLEIREGSSGHPLASLTRIGQDTSFMARHQAAVRQRKMLEQCLEEQSGILAGISAIENQPLRPAKMLSASLLLLVTSFVSLFTGRDWLTALSFIIGAALLIAAFPVSRSINKKKVRALRARQKPRLDELDLEITQRTHSLAELETELDELTDAMS